MMSRLVASQLFHDFMTFPLVCASLRTFLFFQLVPVWRFSAQQVMDKEILEQSLTKGASRAMPASGNEKQFELFVGLDQGVDDLRRCRPVGFRVALSQAQCTLTLGVGA